MIKVILKSKVGEARYYTHIGDQTKPLTVVFDKKNDFKAEVPTKVEYRDGFGVTKVVHENWAKFLLEKYSDALELFAEIEVSDFASQRITKPKGNENE